MKKSPLHAKPTRISHPSAVKTNRQGGFSLVEVLVASFIVTITFLGLTSALLMALRNSDVSTNRATAHDIAVGYAEQLMAFRYDDLRVALKENSEITFRTSSLNPELLESGGTEESVVFGEPFRKKVVTRLSSNPEGESVTEMPMKFVITAKDLNTGSDPYRALEIKIDYSYLPPASNRRGEDEFLKDKVHFVKSPLNAI